MILLGVNLASCYSTSNQAEKMESNDIDPSTYSTNLSLKTILAAVLGKMVIMPLIGVCSIYLLKTFILNVPDGTCFVILSDHNHCIESLCKMVDYFIGFKLKMIPSTWSL
jgi:predicted permease